MTNIHDDRFESLSIGAKLLNPEFHKECERYARSRSGHLFGRERHTDEKDERNNEENVR